MQKAHNDALMNMYCKKTRASKDRAAWISAFYSLCATSMVVKEYRVDGFEHVD
jgi:hypothetical protein